MPEDAKKQTDDLISSLAPTKEWLESKGLTNISQLDEAGMKELKAHLERMVAEQSGQDA
jgi:hypothetical protein